MILKTGNKGFTFVEVMAATAVLALGAVLIYEAFFICLDAFNYCADYLNVVSWADEKIWQAQDKITISDSLGQMETGGQFVNNNRRFNWQLSCSPIDEVKKSYKLYAINLVLHWQAGRRKVSLERNAYALYRQE